MDPKTKTREEFNNLVFESNEIGYFGESQMAFMFLNVHPEKFDQFAWKN